MIRSSQSSVLYGHAAISMDFGQSAHYLYTGHAAYVAVPFREHSSSTLPQSCNSSYSHALNTSGRQLPAMTAASARAIWAIGGPCQPAFATHVNLSARALLLCPLQRKYITQYCSHPLCRNSVTSVLIRRDWSGVTPRCETTHSCDQNLSCALDCRSTKV